MIFSSFILYIVSDQDSRSFEVAQLAIAANKIALEIFSKEGVEVYMISNIFATPAQSVTVVQMPEMATIILLLGAGVYTLSSVI